MQITTSTLQALQTTVSTVFQAAYKDTPLTYEQYTMTVGSSVKTATYGFLARLFKMQEWLGPRQVQNLNTYSTQLTNRTFEATLGVDKEEIEDDALGLFNAKVQMLARTGAYFPQQLVLEAIEGSTTNLLWDGKAFFDTGHTLGASVTGSNQDNKGSETFSPAGWNAVRTKMQSFVGEDGRPLLVNPNLVLIPPAYERMAKYIFNAEFLPTSLSNVQRGEASYVVIPEWAGKTRWITLDTRGPIKPFLFQNRKAVELIAKTALTDDNVFFQREFLWGIDGRGAAMGTMWWLGYLSTGASDVLTQPPLGASADWQ